MFCLYSFLEVLWCHVIFKSLSHFERIFVCGMGECFLTSLIYKQLSSFPNTTCWRDCLFSIVYSCPCCWRLIGCRCVDLSLDFLFCPINPYVCFCANTMLLWLLWLCSIVWCLGGLCLLLCSFFSGMLWQFWIFLWFHINFMVICSSSVENVMGNLIVCVAWSVLSDSLQPHGL